MPRRHWVAAALTWLTVGAAPLAAQGLADYDYDNLSFRGVGLDWGYISPTKVDDTSLWGLRIDLGYLGPAIRVVPSLTFWSSTMRASELNRLATALENLPPLSSRGIDITADDLGIVEWSDLALNLDLHAVWTAPFDVFAYIGAGLGIHALNGRGDAIDDTFIEDLLDTSPQVRPSRQQPSTTSAHGRFKPSQGESTAGFSELRPLSARSLQGALQDKRPFSWRCRLPPDAAKRRERGRTTLFSHRGKVHACFHFATTFLRERFHMSPSA
jgi:hypothetical protein